MQQSVFSQIEDEILDRWKENDVFQKSIDNRDVANRADGKDDEYVFFDGPPFANGLPHYGHLLTGFVKDIYARYHTMLGKKVERRFGWDCHGLPAEMGSEKNCGVSGKLAIEKFGIDKFNDDCRQSVQKYTKEWEEYVTRQARWVDFQNDYKTMDTNYMESVIWAFKTLHTKGLLYEDYKVLPYSWKCQTPLSNFETRMDNSYRQKASKSVVVRFKLKNVPKKLKDIFKDADGFYMLIWTTTPWTLPSNLAVAVNQNVDYTAKEKDGSVYIFATALKDKIKI